ncbi:hypothetical protein [Paracoccus sediminicola]|uniref:hypothetical protein n=1 Tax=Paracoccus sediminicola TaxID=3017783 RepID=UPI0022F0A181|nr:hypothetical protein [Paracoccus sediminicola]WBU56453.1 hypothetical protein PAF18_13385 [Paracoccus sediminicola]
MTKSLTDRERSTGNGRLRSYVTQERESGIHPAITKLHRRPHGRESYESRKTSEYARIERGHEA